VRCFKKVSAYAIKVAVLGGEVVNSCRGSGRDKSSGSMLEGLIVL
jgi:hypothetical protein